MIAAAAPTNQGVEYEPIGNFHRVVAGDTLTAREILDGWKRIIRICAPAAEPLHPTVIEVPSARHWSPREITIVNTSGKPYALRLSGADELYGAADRIIDRPVLRIVPVFSDEDGDGWAVI